MYVYVYTRGLTNCNVYCISNILYNNKSFKIADYDHNDNTQINYITTQVNMIYVN